MRRREFLAVMGAAPAAAAAPPRVGLAFGSYGMKALAARDAVREVAAIGYDGLEICVMRGWSTDSAALSAAGRAELRQMLRDRGLAAAAVQDSLGMTAAKRAYNLGRVKLAAELAHALAPERPPCLDTVLGLRTADWDAERNRMVDEVAEWARAAAVSGMTIAVKIHADQAMDTPEKGEWLLARVASPGVRLVYDYSHMFLAGQGLEESLRRLLPHTALVVTKDSQRNGARHEFLLPGEGSTDYAQYFALLKQLRYTGFVSVEVSSMIHNKPGYDGVAAARLCYSRLAPLMAKAGLREGRG